MKNQSQRKIIFKIKKVKKWKREEDELIIAESSKKRKNFTKITISSKRSQLMNVLHGTSQSALIMASGLRKRMKCF